MSNYPTYGGGYSSAPSSSIHTTSSTIISSYPPYTSTSSNGPPTTISSPTTTVSSPTTTVSPPTSTVSPPTSTVGPSTTPITPPTTTTSQSPSVAPTQWITSSKEVMTSTPVAIVSVSSSNGYVRTYTSTSYSSYRTQMATLVPTVWSEPSSTNVGAIVGGVVGGVAFIALIGIVACILMKRRRKNKNIHKEAYNDPSVGKAVNPHPFNDDFNSYGSPTLAAENVSQGGRPLSMGAMPVLGAKPRPFVQAYNPAYDGQQNTQYAGYDGSQSPPQSEPQQYYEDYQGYQPYSTGQYTQPDTRQYGQQEAGQYTQQQDGYYAQQPEALMTVATSTSGTSGSGGRNVPDEADYYTRNEARTRGSMRHIPDEA